MLSRERLQGVNVPLAIAFLGALFLFLRALSGVGYVEPFSEQEASASPTATLPLNYSHLTNASLDMHDLGYAGFAEHWANFKEAFLSCPPIDATERQTKDEVRRLVAVTNQTAVEDETATNPDLESSSALTSGADSRAKMSVLKSTDLTVAMRMPMRTSVGCLKSHLGSKIGLFVSKKLEVKQEERNFGVSFIGKE